MLNAIVRFSVRYRGVVLVLAAALFLYGLVVLARTKYDVFPEFAPPLVTIETEAPGLTPEQVEALVTKPIEDAINGVTGIATVRSQSIQGLSVITVIFAEGTDLYRARQVVAERLGEVARRLPETVKAPILTPLTASTGTVLVIGLTSKTRSLRDERTFADWTLKPRLLAVPGVARAPIWGGEVRQLQIELDPARLRGYGLGIPDVMAAAARATGVRGAGVLDNANERILVRTEGQALTPALLALSVVREQNGAVIRLGDLGRVVEGAEPRIGAGAIEGVEGVVMMIDAQLGANIRQVAGAVEAALDELRPLIAAEGFTLHPALFRPANFIDVALQNISHSLLLGVILVTAVLVLFLADLGTAAVSLTAIPLSLLAAIIVLDGLGYSVNTLTLGGLAIAIGVVVDDAIIDVENIARRLRENRSRATPGPMPEVAIDASLEVRSSVVYASFIVAIVFTPVFGFTGVQGALFRPLAFAYILAIMASLAVALTVTPALTLTVLGRRQRVEEPALLARLKRGFTRLLGALEARPRTVMGTTAVLVLLALAVIPFLKTTFLPEFNEGHFRLHMAALPGTSIDESLRIGEAVTHTLRADPRVRSVAQRVGRAELGEDTFGPYYSELEVDLVPLRGRAAATVADDLRARLARIPGVSFALMPFLTERIQEVLSGSTAPVVVKLFGQSLDSLDLAARSVASAVRGMRGAADVTFGTPPVSPEVLVRLRPQALVAAGVPAGDALQTVAAGTGGATVAQVFEGNRSTDVVVRLDPRDLTRPEDLGDIPLIGTGGRLVTLAQVADIARRSGRYAVAHEGSRRVQIVTTDVRGRDVASFTQDLEQRLRATTLLPRGVYAEIGGTARAQRTAQRELLARSFFALVGIVLLLWLSFGETRRVLLILVNLPFALVGGVFAVALTGASLSLGSLVGFVTLFGITTRNAIMLISHYDHLVRHEGATWGGATAIRGAAERLGPILMTALVTGLGLLPLALGSGDPGREIEGPLALVILGGLVTSTALSLFVLPTLALAFGHFREEAAPDAA